MSDQAIDIQEIAVVGAGTMGYGIALCFAMADKEVTLYDVDEDVLQTAKSNITSGIETFAESGNIDYDTADNIQDRIEYELSLESSVATADFVTEAVPEDITIKKDVFMEIDEYTRNDPIIATNTSGLSVSELANVVDKSRQVLGTHYFNPAHIVPVVEIVRGDETADSVVNQTYELFDYMEYKTPILVNEDIPGFIANRIQLAMAYEAESLLDRGVATAEDIDRAVRGSFGFRLPVLGIFEKADHAGLDVHVDVMSYLMEELDRGTEPHDYVTDLVENGQYGLKTGKGFFDWSGNDPKDVLMDRDRRLIKQLNVYSDP